MLLLILSYLGGTLTILSPCVLPVVPFIFSKSDRPFLKSGLPILIGMALSFTIFATLSVVGGRWIVQANQVGRIISLVFFGILGFSLLFSQFAERITQPFVRLGGALQRNADAGSGLWSSLLLGASVGLLWAPCAGPILGLVLAGASFERSNQTTFVLLLMFAMGAASSLAVALLASGKVLKYLKKGFVAEEWIKRGLGATVLLSVLAIALGLDTRVLAKLSFLSTNSLEQGLVDSVSKNKSLTSETTLLPNEGTFPTLEGAESWINSTALSPDSLRGKVVLIDFWTYSCINCLRTLPYLKAWAEKYRDQGLVVIGVHTPEFAFERDLTNIKKAVRDLGINYSVAVDNDHLVWSAFKNQYWPAHYFIDRKGRIRYHHFGEGNYDESVKVIEALLQEPGSGNQSNHKSAMEKIKLQISATGVEAPPSGGETSPETYLGYGRQEGFVSSRQIVKDKSEVYNEPPKLDLNQWSLRGQWKISEEMASLFSKTGSVSFRFEARDVHLVIGSNDGKPIRYRVTIDDRAPNEDHGVDSTPAGDGIVDSHRLYQLIRQKKNVGVHTLRIEFLDPGVRVFAFTFG
jgi:cytochrome c biogenesis protein CcdA/thiol-disulfide isomerase/thioredoxin